MNKQIEYLTSVSRFNYLVLLFYFFEMPPVKRNDTISKNKHLLNIVVPFNVVILSLVTLNDTIQQNEFAYGEIQSE